MVCILLIIIHHPNFNIGLHIFVNMDPVRHMLISYFRAFHLFIFQLMNETNSPLSQLNVLPLDMLQQKGFLCYDPSVFFQTHFAPSPSPITYLLPIFSNSPTKFKLGLEYVQRNHQDIPTSTNGSPLPTPNLEPHLAPPIFQWTTHIHCPPNDYGFSHSSLLTTLSSTFIPDNYT